MEVHAESSCMCLKVADRLCMTGFADWAQPANLFAALKLDPYLVQAAAPAAAPEPQWEHSALETVEAHQFYNAVGRTGIKYGPHFRMVQRTNISADTSALLRCTPASPHHLHTAPPGAWQLISVRCGCACNVLTFMARSSRHAPKSHAASKTLQPALADAVSACAGGTSASSACWTACCR